MSQLSDVVARSGTIPLAWAGSTSKMDYLNFGDALSPVMVALCAGLPVERIPSRSATPRLAAVGTIGHGLEGGSVWFWGTGCSNMRNPSAPAAERVPYQPPADTAITIAATRGPVSRKLLGGDPADPAAVYGDPVWLLPRFYRPAIEKRWDIGVILHLSEIADRALDAHPHAKYARYQIPPDQVDRVHLINTVTPIALGGLQDKLDEILACRRIVSTSLHGMVIAESYGIPCLYFPPAGPQGLSSVDLGPDSTLDLRIIDLYTGLGVDRLPVYAQDRLEPTDWDDLIRAIDRAWRPVTLDEAALLAALPVPVQPLEPPRGGTIFDLPLLNALTFQHDVGELSRLDRARAKTGPVSAPLTPARPAIRDLAQAVDEAQAVPLAWVAASREHPFLNLGDALSPVIVAAISGRPVVHRNFDDPRERLVSIGSIGHGQTRGIAHLWGTGGDAERAWPTETQWVVHAMRGPVTGNALRRLGVAVPEIYGDPAWFLPRILPRRAVAPRWELGVVVHISELESADPDAGVKALFKRYHIPAELSSKIRLINTYTAPSIEALLGKVDDILDCRRIVSTSFHGLLIPEAYGIPCMWFGTHAGGGKVIDPADPADRLDHRAQDFYVGAKVTRLPVYCQERGVATDWEAVIRWIDQAWAPSTYDGRALFDAFPLPKIVSFDDVEWPLRGRTVRSLVPPPGP